MPFEPSFDKSFVVLSQIDSSEYQRIIALHFEETIIFDLLQNDFDIETFLIKVGLFWNVGFGYVLLQYFLDLFLLFLFFIVLFRHVLI